MNKYIGISKFDDVNANGYSLVIFFSSCPHRCLGCHNPSTWTNKENGEYFTKDIQDELLNHFKENEFYYDNLVLSGGDPLCDDNLKYVLDFTKIFKAKFPNKEVWCYTGFNLDEVKNSDKSEMLQLCDYIKCGRYIENLKCLDNVQYDIRLATSNQKIYKKGLDF